MKCTGGARSKTFRHVIARRRGTEKVDRERAAREGRGKPGEAGVPEVRKKALAEGDCPECFTPTIVYRNGAVKKTKCFLASVLPKASLWYVHLGLLITHALLHCGMASPFLLLPNSQASSCLCSLQLCPFPRKVPGTAYTEVIRTNVLQKGPVTLPLLGSFR